MKRVEVIANQEFLSQFLDELEERLPSTYYTIIDVMRGKGKKGQANGDGTWPERNFYCIIFTDSLRVIDVLYRIIAVLKHDHPANSLKIFISDAHTVPLADYLVEEKKEAEKRNSFYNPTL